MKTDEELMWTCLSKTELLKTPVFTVTSRHNRSAAGIEGDYIVNQCNDWVIVIAEKDDAFLMVRQFRYGAGTEMLELPAGKLEKDDKDVLAAAKRELSEETGFEAQNWTDLGYTFTTPAICTEKLYLFKAENLVAGSPHPDDGEFIEHCEVEISEVYKMIQSGKINDAKTICAIFRGLGGGVL